MYTKCHPIVIIRKLNSPSRLSGRGRLLLAGFSPPRSNFKYCFSMEGMGNVSTDEGSSEFNTAVREHSFNVFGWISRTEIPKNKRKKYRKIINTNLF